MTLELNRLLKASDGCGIGLVSVDVRQTDSQTDDVHPAFKGPHHSRISSRRLCVVGVNGKKPR